jgi:MFS family permease
MHLAFSREKLYRIIVTLGVITTVALVMIVPDRFKEPDDWAYYYATENLSHGRLTVDNTLHQQQVAEAQQQSGQLIQYVQLGPDTWAFEKSPGYVYFLIPFYLLGVPQLANIFLAAGLVLVTYLLLKQLKDERVACISSLLVLFTPVSLAMLQREFMDGFASAAFPGIGGGLYILYSIKKSEIGSASAAFMLFLSGLFLGLGVAARYTDATIAAVFAVHFLATQIQSLRTGQCAAVLRAGLSFGLGAAIPLGLLLLYQKAVFGAPFAYGYEYTKLNVKFAYDYLGEPKAWQIIVTNLKKLWLPLITGFPLLLAALPGIVILLWQKTSAAIPSLRRYQGKPGWPRFGLGLTLLLIGWFLAVFMLYMMYEWTANQRVDVPFIIVTRFYLPALLPIVIMAVFFLSRLPNKLVICLMAAALTIGVVFFAQASQRDLKTVQSGPLPQKGIPAQSSPEERSRLIEQVRLEVKAVPTNASNMQRRLDVLVMWIGELNSQRYPVGQLMPPSEVQRIRSLILQNQTVEAGRLIDDAYRKLEQLVATKPNE